MVKLRFLSAALLCFFHLLTGFGQVVDFENITNLKPGDPVGEISLKNSTCTIQFFSGHTLQDTVPLTLQRVAFNSGNGGFYGTEFDKDCEGNRIPKERINQINGSQYTLNETLSNRERVGCYFISGILKGEKLPSIFIQYNEGTQSFSADLLDVDGHENTIEAYDIYCYATSDDYPDNPINRRPLEIRSIGRTVGYGILGDNGGVMPFNIALTKPFTLVEIRPIQQVSGANEPRYEFGFALDNFSPCTVEEAPYTPPYLSETPMEVATVDKFTSSKLMENRAKPQSSPSVDSTEKTFAPVYFDFDQHTLTAEAKKQLNALINYLEQDQKNTFRVELKGYTDPKGSNDYNLKLAEKRVTSVRDFLLLNGVVAAQIDSHYFGENYPGALTDSDWKKRAVFIRVSRLE